MIAKLWFEKIKNKEKTFADVPAKLKDKVAELLKAEGLDELVTE